MFLQQTIWNFGRNICFTPRHLYAPRSEQEVIDLLERHAGGRIRVVGSRHAWSPAIVSDDVLIDLRHINQVQIERNAEGEVWATIGGGCQIKKALAELHSRAGVTLPAIGIITEQTMAGATATGTHGSGRHSLSHYLEEVRFAAYDIQTGKARIHVVRSGEELRAARCSLGCLGVVLSVRLRCVPQYLIAESITRYKTIEEVLSYETRFPRQHFFLIPHLWEWIALHQREVHQGPAHVSRFAWLFKLYAILVIDIGFHLLLKLLLFVPSNRGLTHWFYRKLMPAVILQDRPFTGRSDRFLTMEITRFRHLEMELFVPRRRLTQAARYVQEVLRVFDGSTENVSAEFAADLERLELLKPLYRLRGTYAHHYPITFRKVLPDDTLISMASDHDEPWYAISFITYLQQRRRGPFFALADFLASSMAALFGARPHWGKYFPLSAAEVERLYPNLHTFREICHRYDPDGIFRNDFCRRTLGFEESMTPAVEGANASYGNGDIP